MPDDYKATLLAVDGNVAGHVPAQASKIPESATHLFVSVGGNDALGEMSILQLEVSSSAEVLDKLSDAASAFEHRYGSMLESVLSFNKPTAICTIYYPRFPRALYAEGRGCRFSVN